MMDFANGFLLVFAGLFPILNPIGTAPIFLALTSACTEDERSAIARRVAINSVLLLAGAMLIGSHLLVFFGITLPVVRIAGGLVLIALSWKLLHGGVVDERSSEARSQSTVNDSFYPLTMPLTVGPGSIAIAIGLGSSAAGRTLYVIAGYAARRIGDCGVRRTDIYGLFLLPLRQAYIRPVRRERCQCRHTLIRLHSPVHRHSTAVGRLQHAGHASGNEYAAAFRGRTMKAGRASS